MSCVNKLGLVLVVLASFVLAASFAGRQSKMMEQQVTDASRAVEEEEAVELPSLEEGTVFHERLLRANHRDYGKYDPSPTFVKPPFKLIPN